jgi:hypothetical protein
MRDRMSATGLRQIIPNYTALGAKRQAKATGNQPGRPKEQLATDAWGAFELITRPPAMHDIVPGISTRDHTPAKVGATTIEDES